MVKRAFSREGIDDKYLYCPASHDFFKKRRKGFVPVPGSSSLMRPEIHDESLIPNANDRSWSAFKPGVIHVLVTGSVGYIGSHAALRLLKDSYCVTIVDNFSRRKLSAIKVLQEQFPEPRRLQFIYVDLGDVKIVNMIFSENAFDATMYCAGCCLYWRKHPWTPQVLLQCYIKYVGNIGRWWQPMV